jgi:hypothetical protein
LPFPMDLLSEAAFMLILKLIQGPQRSVATTQVRVAHHFKRNYPANPQPCFKKSHRLIRGRSKSQIQTQRLRPLPA